MAQENTLPDDGETLTVLTSFLDRQGQLVGRTVEQLLEDTDSLDPGSRSLAFALTLLLVGVHESIGSIGLLASNNRARDAFVTGRTIYLTIVNACFIAAQGTESAERAFRHAQQKAYRDLNRNVSFGDKTFSLKFNQQIDLNSHPKLKAAIDEYTGRKGREIRLWTPEGLKEQLEEIDKKYGDHLSRFFGLAQLAIYRHASEIAHGTIFGVLWSMGAATPKPSPASITELRQHKQADMNMLMFLLNPCVSNLVQIISIEFPSCELIRDESKRLLDELMASEPIIRMIDSAKARSSSYEFDH
jgi:uncharacterized protein DUF5677